MTRIAKRTIAVTLAASSLVIFLIWSAFATIFLYLMSFGDGSASAGPEDVRTFYLPSVYLLIVAASCLPFFRRWSLLGIGVVAHTILLLAFLRLNQHERVGGAFMLLMSIPFGLIAIGWLALCTGRFRNCAEPDAAPNGGPATQLGNSGVTEGPPSVS
jgi:hypothetical protein